MLQSTSITLPLWPSVTRSVSLPTTVLGLSLGDNNADSVVYEKGAHNTILIVILIIKRISTNIADWPSTHELGIWRLFWSLTKKKEVLSLCCLTTFLFDLLHHHSFKQKSQSINKCLRAHWRLKEFKRSNSPSSLPPPGVKKGRGVADGQQATLSASHISSITSRSGSNPHSQADTAETIITLDSWSTKDIMDHQYHP